MLPLSPCSAGSSGSSVVVNRSLGSRLPRLPREIVTRSWLLLSSGTGRAETEEAKVPSPIGLEGNRPRPPLVPRRCTICYSITKRFSSRIVHTTLYDKKKTLYDYYQRYGRIYPIKITINAAIISEIINGRASKVCVCV